MKNLFYTLLILFIFILFILFSYLFILNLSSQGFFRAIYFSYFTWERKYDPESSSYFISSDNNTYYWINFNNSKDHFLQLDSLLNLKSKKFVSDLMTSSLDTSIVFYFYWDTPDLISKNISKRESEHYKYLGLFNLITRFNSGKFLIENIDIERGFMTDYKPLGKESSNFDLSLYDYKFSTHMNSIYVQNFDEFNFVFWAQAQDFIIKRFKQDRLGKSFKFYNSGKLIAIFDFDKNIGYRITVL